MAKLDLDNIEITIDVLEVTWKGVTYNVPLGNALSPDELERMKSPSYVVEFFKRFIPEDVYSTIPYPYINHLMKQWSEETAKSSGLKLGE